MWGLHIEFPQRVFSGIDRLVSVILYVQSASPPQRPSRQIRRYLLSVDNIRLHRLENSSELGEIIICTGTAASVMLHNACCRFFIYQSKDNKAGFHKICRGLSYEYDEQASLAWISKIVPEEYMYSRDVKYPLSIPGDGLPVGLVSPKFVQRLRRREVIDRLSYFDNNKVKCSQQSYLVNSQKY